MPRVSTDIQRFCRYSRRLHQEKVKPPRAGKDPDGFYPKRRFGRGPIVSRGANPKSDDTPQRMTRVRYDPSFITHPRWEALGADAYVMHSGACSYIVEHLTDGVISHAAALRLPLVRNPRRALTALVDGEMWTDRGDGTYQVCECLDDLRSAAGRGDEQPSKTFVDRERDRKQRNKKDWQARKEPGSKPGYGPGYESGLEPRTAQSGTAQHGAVQEPPVPVPALHADDDPGAVCEHGTPNGTLLTSAGDPRCPMCRRLSLVPNESA